MYLKKVLNQPNLVGTMMIALLFGAGFVYAFAFDGFNVETATGGKIEAWLAESDGDSDYGTPRIKCKENFNDYCDITHPNGATEKCAKTCSNVGKQKNRCDYCRNNK